MNFDKPWNLSQPWRRDKDKSLGENHMARKMQTIKEYMGGLPLERKGAWVVIFAIWNKEAHSQRKTRDITKWRNWKNAIKMNLFFSRLQSLWVYIHHNHTRRTVFHQLSRTYTRLTNGHTSAQRENSRERETKQKRYVIRMATSRGWGYSPIEDITKSQQTIYENTSDSTD